MRRRWLWAAGLVIVLLTGLYFWQRKEADKIDYREEKVARGEIKLSILSTGTVQPENRLEIKPPIAGRVDRVLVDEGDKVHKGQTLAWLSSTERAAMLDAARSSGAEELKRWQDLYRPTPLVAPISGTIILRSVEPGQTFTVNDAVLVMSDRLTVKAQVDETDIAKVKLKQPAVIVLDAYSGEEIPGHVDQIAFEAKTVNNVTTYLVDVLPDKTPDFMRSGMTANVTFMLESKTNVVTVPAESIKTKNGTSTVMVRGSGGDAVEKIVETGISDGKNTEIISGLGEGEILLLPTISFDKKDRGVNPFAPSRSRGKSRKK